MTFSAWVNLAPQDCVKVQTTSKILNKTICKIAYKSYVLCVWIALSHLGYGMAQKARRYIDSVVYREGPVWNHEEMLYLHGYIYSSPQLNFAFWRIFSLAGDKDTVSGGSSRYLCVF